MPGRRMPSYPAGEAPHGHGAFPGVTAPPLQDEDDVVVNDRRVLIAILPDPDASMPEDRVVRRVAAEEMLFSPGDDREWK
jgi:hypothetical protein